MKRENVITTISVGVVFVVVLAFAWYFMSGMLDVLKRGQGVAVGATTNVVMRATIPLNMSGAENKVEGSDASIISAYDSLSNELASWMAIMGLFAAVFGLLIPIGSYFLQQRSLKEERESLVEKMDAKVQEATESINKMREDLERGTFQKMKPLWNFLAANFDRFLVKDGEKIRDGKAGILEVANFIIGFDIYLDCLVRAENGAMIMEAIEQYRPIIDAVKSSSAWQQIRTLLKAKIMPNPEFVKGKDFSDLIGNSPRFYGWLKSFYDEIIPWKFG